jgi:hypothetical protein
LQPGKAAAAQAMIAELSHTIFDRLIPISSLAVSMSDDARPEVYPPAAAAPESIGHQGNRM